MPLAQVPLFQNRWYYPLFTLLIGLVSLLVIQVEQRKYLKLKPTESLSYNLSEETNCKSFLKYKFLNRFKKKKKRTANVTVDPQAGYIIESLGQLQKNMTFARNISSDLLNRALKSSAGDFNMQVSVETPDVNGSSYHLSLPCCCQTPSKEPIHMITSANSILQVRKLRLGEGRQAG